MFIVRCEDNVEVLELDEAKRLYEKLDQEMKAYGYAVDLFNLGGNK